MTRAQIRRARAVLDVQCARCGHIHSVTSEEVIKGRWRDCPKCDAPADAEPEGDDDAE